MNKLISARKKLVRPRETNLEKSKNGTFHTKLTLPATLRLYAKASNNLESCNPEKAQQKEGINLTVNYTSKYQAQQDLAYQADS